MSWWHKIFETIEVGDELFTPGRGMEGNRQKPFWVIDINDDNLAIKSGNFPLTIERECFDAIESALVERRYRQLRVASLHANIPLEGSADELIHEATGANLSRGNYVCAILVKIGVVRYVMNERRKCIELQPNQKKDQINKQMNYKLTVIIEKDNHGYYAFTPDLQGCQSQGDTFEEVMANIREAIELYLETMSEDEIKTSLSREILTTSLEVQVG